MGKIIIANWKANPTTLEEAMDLFDFYLSEILKYSNVKLVVCPPFVYIEELAKLLNAKRLTLNVSLGAQDIFWEESGPYTGEISTDMLRSFNVGYVLVGHSDRRYKIGESDEVVNKKIKAALAADITPVLFVGERNRDDNRKLVLEQQLSADLAGLTAEEVTKVLVTYEPVWAISTQPGAQPDTSKNTLEAIGVINNFITKRYALNAARCLYGGSVNQDNVADFLEHSEISGAVIGGASLRKNEFAEILKIVNATVAA